MQHHFIDEWADYWRVGVLIVAIYCFVALIVRFRRYGKNYTTKTKDYWYSMLMWSLVGIAIPIQGVWFDLHVTPLLVITTAAVLVTGKGLHKKGSWGGGE